MEEIEQFHQAAMDLCAIDEKEKIRIKNPRKLENKNLMIKLGEDSSEQLNIHERAEAFRMKKFKKVHFKIEHFKQNIAIEAKEIKIRF